MTGRLNASPAAPVGRKPRKPDYAALLAAYLGDAYHLFVVQHRPLEDATARLAKCLEADAELLAAAKTRRGELTKSVTDKCFISKQQKALLDGALGEPA